MRMCDIRRPWTWPPLVSAGAQPVSTAANAGRHSARPVIRRSCALGVRIANKNPCLVGNRTNGRALEGGKWGVLPMPTAEYFRRQADICIRLSLIASSEEVMTRLIAMAQDYHARVDVLEARARSSAPKTISEGWNQLE